MRHNYIYILLVIISVLFLSNCKHSTPTTDEDLFWMEHQGNFYTQDIDRAQDNIPLKILLPEYLPGSGQIIPIPQIDGPLKESQDDIERVEINIKYAINTRHDLPALIIITESNSSYTLGEPELNPD